MKSICILLCMLVGCAVSAPFDDNMMPSSNSTTELSPERMEQIKQEVNKKLIDEQMKQKEDAFRLKLQQEAQMKMANEQAMKSAPVLTAVPVVPVIQARADSVDNILSSFADLMTPKILNHAPGAPPAAAAQVAQPTAAVAPQAPVQTVNTQVQQPMVDPMQQQQLAMQAQGQQAVDPRMMNFPQQQQGMGGYPGSGFLASVPLNMPSVPLGRSYTQEQLNQLAASGYPMARDLNGNIVGVQEQQPAYNAGYQQAGVPH